MRQQGKYRATTGLTEGKIEKPVFEKSAQKRGF